MKNFGVKKLYLVNPKVDISAASIYASHAADVLDHAMIVPLTTVREENDMLVATTAVRARKKSNVIRRMISPENVRVLLASCKTSSLVFGRDTTGLTNEEIATCDVTTTIDTSSAYRALNLGHAVAIMLYLVSRRSRRSLPRQTRKARKIFSETFYDLASASCIQPHKMRNLKEAGKRVAASSGLTDKQLQLLSGVFRKAVMRIEELQVSNT
jgi:TrmH family RNA methyltransferase